MTRTNYYQEGWLATGNIRGIVGVTFTTSTNRKNAEYPLRTNYNLRGHRSDVRLINAIFYEFNVEGLVIAHKSRIDIIYSITDYR